MNDEQITENPTSINQPSNSEVCQYVGCSNLLTPGNLYVDTDTGYHICNEHAKDCDECGNTHSIDHLIYKDPYYYCKSCLEAKFATCPNCKEVVEKDELLFPNRHNRWSMKNGGCTECSTNCSSCERVVDKDNVYNYDGDDYCDDCFSDNYGSCEECGDTVDRESLIYNDEDNNSYCQSCYNDKFVTCDECNKTIEKNDAYESDDEYYCQTCYEKMGPTQYKEYTEFKNFSYTKKDRFLNLLYKLLPITVKDLKTKQPTLANGLSDLITFSKGKTITLDMVNEFRQTLNPEEFPVNYTVWDSDLQRSISTLDESPVTKPQLVMNILASSEMISKFKENPALYDLFDKINSLSKESTHPYIKDQIGWARLELDPSGEFILVDEIQSDHSNATFRLKNSENDYEIIKIRNALKNKYKITDEQLDKMLAEYANLLKDFPNIANQAIIRFARKNNFKKLFWHTYESGMKIKKNEPPRSLYEKTPKENFFLPSQNKPFGLEGEFFEREAKKADKLYKLARKLYVKYLHKIN